MKEAGGQWKLLLEESLPLRVPPEVLPLLIKTETQEGESQKTARSAGKLILFYLLYIPIGHEELLNLQFNE